MELTPSQKKTVRHQFDSYCRKVLRKEARDYMRNLARQNAHEVSLSELSEEQMARLYVLDEYPSEQFHFAVQGYDVAVKNEKLAEALSVFGKPVTACASVKEGVETAIAHTGKDEAVIAFGSLYMVGDIRNAAKE